MISLKRRRTLQVTPLVGLALFGSTLRPTALAATPSCSDDDEPTPANDEGPYFTPKSPERASLLESGLNGNTLIVSGTVLTASCRPIPGAILDFWQASAEGAYDNSGFKLRGHQFADKDGRFRLETVMPGLYPGRTRHIHVKAIVPGGVILTTQLYFPAESLNARDRLFNPGLVMDLADEGGLKAGRFDFVLKTG
jgi:protocatechuate 3,4-dioxygenase beta subunit